MATVETESLIEVLDAADNATAEVIIQLELDNLAVRNPVNTRYSNRQREFDHQLSRALLESKLDQYRGSRTSSANQVNASGPVASVSGPGSIEHFSSTTPVVQLNSGSTTPDTKKITTERAQQVEVVAKAATVGTQPSEANLSPMQKLAQEFKAAFRGETTPDQQTEAKAPRSQEIKKVNCVIDDEAFESSSCLHAPCGHYWCAEHLDLLFSRSLADHSDYPPRCCAIHPIPFEAVRTLLSAKLVKEFETKKPELDEAHKDPKPTYCHVQTCSKYIGQEHKSAGVGRCPQCKSSTCLSCKHANHPGGCQNDSDEQKTREIAKEMGWKECPECHNIVERETGCNHMTIIDVVAVQGSAMLVVRKEGRADARYTVHAMLRKRKSNQRQQ